MRQEELSAAVNVSANSLKIYDHSKAVFFLLTLPGFHGKKDKSDALLLSAVFGTR